MKIQQLRNATIIVEFAQHRVLVDPMLAPQGALPPLRLFGARQRNPLVELPSGTRDELESVTHCLITHCQKGHFDHLDRAGTRWLRERGRGITGQEVWAALGTLRAAARVEIETTRQYDAVLTPTLAAPPPLVGQLRDDADPAADFDAQKQFTPFTAPYNMSGQPAVSVPLHWNADGLPIGIQLIGRPYEEDTLLRIAAGLEAAAPWAQRRPDCW